MCDNNDVEAVLLARPYRPRPAASQGIERAEAIKGVATMTTRSAPRRHWFSYGTDPLPTGSEALDEPFSAFPSWFLRIECDRCGKVQMVNEVHMKRGAMPIRDIIARMPRDGCGGRQRSPRRLVLARLAVTRHGGLCANPSIGRQGSSLGNCIRTSHPR